MKNQPTPDFASLEAYALGYYEGRAIGTDSNVFEEDDLRLMYRRGYDAGVADYCRYDMDEAEPT